VTTRVIDFRGLESLLNSLIVAGFDLIGPTVRDQAIVHDRISGIHDLPKGVTDIQEGGRYRLQQRDDEALFGYNSPSQSWKSYLYPSRSRLFTAARTAEGISFQPVEPSTPRYAFFGVRPCDLAAISIQDRVFMGSGYVDEIYAANRQDNFIVAVNCVEAGATCFCDSMGTGPRATSGYDIVLTEISPGTEFVVSSGSARGEAMLAKVDGKDATEQILAREVAGLEDAVAQMGRRLNTDGIHDLLVGNSEHPRWNEVAERCLTCGNCTMACPTCFCSTTQDSVTLDGNAIRSRRWDSCFGLEFSNLHGRPVRETTRSRYRQWLTHKLATWYDQFGSSGCVGCGRCITWCPVGIDITEEARAIREQVPA
jgi:sulfhydrogenase subunit beta (sulfur reductase)